MFIACLYAVSRSNNFVLRRGQELFLRSTNVGFDPRLRRLPVLSVAFLPVPRRLPALNVELGQG